MGYDDWKADWESMQDPYDRVGPLTEGGTMPYAEHAMPPEPEPGREPLGMVDIDECLAAAWALLPRAASVNLYLEAHQHRYIPGIATRSEMLYQFCVCWGDGSVMQSHCTGRYPSLKEALEALREYADEHVR